jgi:hypothetical protein
MTADQILAQQNAQPATCLAIPSWLSSRHPRAKARRPGWKSKSKPPSGLQGENRARLGRFRPAGEYLTPAGFQRAQNPPWIDRTRRHQSGDWVGAKVVQVPGMDHMGLSRIQKSLPEVGRVGLAVLYHENWKSVPPNLPSFRNCPLYLLRAGNLAPPGRQPNRAFDFLFYLL